MIDKGQSQTINKKLLPHWKDLLLFFLVLPYPCNAQSKVFQLGHYSIGITTIDSLQHNDFEEEEQSYVKGTIALPCAHIRIFKSLAIDAAGISVSNLSLAFYDNRLFKITCDYTDNLQNTFISTHGKGTPKPTGSFLFCNKNKPMLIWGEIWKNGDYMSYAVHTKGYTPNCEMQESAKLIIVSKRLSALASDCELKNTDLFVDEFEKTLTNP